MKTIANRLIVIAVSTIALGTMAFGQNVVTAEIPFAFRTASGVMPAGTYQLSQLPNAFTHTVLIRNTVSYKSGFAGYPLLDAYHSTDKPVVVFVCANGDCSLKAIRTSSGSLEYRTPYTRGGEKMAVISIPVKYSNGD